MILRAWKMWRIRRIARRELPHTDGVENAHLVGETLVKLFARGDTVESIYMSVDTEDRPELLEMMRVAAIVYCPSKLGEIERAISAQVPNNISSL